MAKYLEVETDTDNFVLKGRSCELSSFSFIPTSERDTPKERVFFNSEKKERYPYSTYDRLFTVKEGYDNKLHRDDREHAKSKGLTVNDEEKQKVVPSLASSEYGHRLNDTLDPPGRNHVRIAIVNTEFFRRNGTTT